MRDKERIKRILDKLNIFWNQVPDWRLGQLVCNIIDYDYYKDKRTDSVEIFYLEDDDFEKELDRILDEFKKFIDKKKVE